jgi:hypothetical protein
MQTFMAPGVLQPLTPLTDDQKGVNSFDRSRIKKATDAAASHLHRMFFGSKQFVREVFVANDMPEGEPDYYSSYE